MTLKTFVFHSLLLAVLATTAPAIASNYNFLKDTPYGNFTVEDHKIFDENLNAVLDKGADGESRAWSNPDTKASGEIKALKTFKRDDVTCRTLMIANKAKVYSAKGNYKFCKTAPDKWTLAE